MQAIFHNSGVATGITQARNLISGIAGRVYGRSVSMLPACRLNGQKLTIQREMAALPRGVRQAHQSLVGRLESLSGKLGSRRLSNKLVKHAACIRNKMLGCNEANVYKTFCQLVKLTKEQAASLKAAGRATDAQVLERVIDIYQSAGHFIQRPQSEGAGKAGGVKDFLKLLMMSLWPSATFAQIGSGWASGHASGNSTDDGPCQKQSQTNQCSAGPFFEKLPSEECYAPPIRLNTSVPSPYLEITVMDSVGRFVDEIDIDIYDRVGDSESGRRLPGVKLTRLPPQPEDDSDCIRAVLTIDDLTELEGDCLKLTDGFTGFTETQRVPSPKDKDPSVVELNRLACNSYELEATGPIRKWEIVSDNFCQPIVIQGNKGPLRFNETATKTLTITPINCLGERGTPLTRTTRGELSPGCEDDAVVQPGCSQEVATTTSLFLLGTSVITPTLTMLATPVTSLLPTLASSAGIYQTLFWPFVGVLSGLLAITCYSFCGYAAYKRRQSNNRGLRQLRGGDEPRASLELKRVTVSPADFNVTSHKQEQQALVDHDVLQESVLQGDAPGDESPKDEDPNVQ